MFDFQKGILLWFHALTNNEYEYLHFGENEIKATETICAYNNMNNHIFLLTKADCE